MSDKGEDEKEPTRGPLFFFPPCLVPSAARATPKHAAIKFLFFFFFLFSMLMNERTGRLPIFFFLKDSHAVRVRFVEWQRRIGRSCDAVGKDASDDLALGRRAALGATVEGAESVAAQQQAAVHGDMVERVVIERRAVARV